MKYWINSNTGDYISEIDGKYKLHLITRYDPVFMMGETIELNKSQFNAVKGFIPIKKKKLFARKRSKYGRTLSDGTKAKPERFEIPTVAEMREQILKDILG